MELVTYVELDAKPDNEHHEKEDDNEEPRMMLDIEDSFDSTIKVLNEKFFCDRLINAKVEIQLGDLMRS